MHWPERIDPRDGWYRSPGQIIDVVPTILDVAGADYPEKMHGNDLPALDGLSLRPAFDGEPLERDEPLFVEHETNAFVRDGKWKLVGRGVAAHGGTEESRWELYDMEVDRTETEDLADARPEKVEELAAQWEEWAQRVEVYPRGDRSPRPPPPEAVPAPPQVGGSPFTITATVRSPKPEGVALAHGGVRFGYSLFFRDGRPAFALRNEGELTELVADDPVSGEVEITASIDAETMTLAVDGEQVASRKSPGLLSQQPGLGLYEGLDFRDPVADYEAPNRLRGKLVDYRIEVDRSQVAMRTPWGEKVTAENAWREYPRPMMRRQQWTNLNGHWNYAITGKDRSSAPEEWDGKVLVPFALEAPLSGVEEWIKPRDAIWYRRSVEVEKRAGKRYRLNFEAVDYRSTVWINGEEVGSHTGGNLPFSFDVTEALEDGTNVLTLRVTDATERRGTYQLHGKQRLNPKGIWYTPVSGIWQTVWMEEVPTVHLTDVRITPSTDGTVKLRLRTAGSAKGLEATARASLDGEVVATAEGGPAGRGPVELTLTIPEPELWTPDSPVLYEIEIAVGEDRVRSHAGLREVGLDQDDDGHWRFALNGEPLFHWGTLDQGWWPDGLLTPPSDEAMVSDIEFLKEAGFNTIRKHIKVEPRRYYWHCDRMGMLVWQDHVSHRDPVDDPEWSRLKPNPAKAVWPDDAHEQFMAELKRMMDALGSHPSIVQWVPFNERWGQHQTVAVGDWTVDYDPTRHVNVASGGNWFPSGHIVDAHAYPHPKFPFEQDHGRWGDYVKVMGEFGGHGFPVEGHLWDPDSRNWGYGGLPEDKDEWLERYRTSLEMLGELKSKGIAGGIYTQTTDVEGEINGLLTYDRRVRKVAPEKLRAMAEEILFRAEAGR